MFTGLVEMTGVLVNLHGEHLTLRPSKPFADPQYGESVAVNGCCLTLERELPGGTLEFFTLAETQRRTNLGRLKPGSLLNIERALRVGDRLGGHIVSGHIDAAAPVLDYRKMPDGDFELRVALPELLARNIVEKGSIAIDGVSLTVIEVGGDFFTVRLIPVTRSDTALVERTPGSLVNLEGDVIGKYVRRQFELRSGRARSRSPTSRWTLCGKRGSYESAGRIRRGLLQRGRLRPDAGTVPERARLPRRAGRCVRQRRTAHEAAQDRFRQGRDRSARTRRLRNRRAAAGAEHGAQDRIRPFFPGALQACARTAVLRGRAPFRLGTHVPGAPAYRDALVLLLRGSFGILDEYRLKLRLGVRLPGNAGLLCAAAPRPAVSRHLAFARMYAGSTGQGGASPSPLLQ